MKTDAQRAATYRSNHRPERIGAYIDVDMKKAIDETAKSNGMSKTEALEMIIGSFISVPKQGTALIDVTPSMAAKFMESNTNNRRLSEAVVRRYAQDMSSGNWKQTHQGVAIYSDGVVADGQHRLAAIVKSGVTLRMLVTTGIDRASGAYIDAHRARSQSDSVKIAGLSDWIGISDIAIAKVLNDSEAMPTQEIVDFCHKYKDAFSFCKDNFRKNPKRGLTSAPIASAFWLAYASGEDTKRLEEFAQALITGVAHSLDDVAVIRLREFLLDNKSKLNRRDRALDAHLRTQRAIKAFCDRQQIGKLCKPEKPIYSLKG